MGIHAMVRLRRASDGCWLCPESSPNQSPKVTVPPNKRYCKAARISTNVVLHIATHWTPSISRAPEICEWIMCFLRPIYGLPVRVSFGPRVVSQRFAWLVRTRSRGLIIGLSGSIWYWKTQYRSEDPNLLMLQGIDTGDGRINNHPGYKPLGFPKLFCTMVLGFYRMRLRKQASIDMLVCAKARNAKLFSARGFSSLARSELMECQVCCRND
jgi:hypothetical protein